MCTLPETKEQLKNTTDDAVNRGAFGAPTFFIRREGKPGEDMLFGSDR